MANNPVLSAFSDGISSSCKSLPGDIEVRFSESESDGDGNQAIELVASNVIMLWSYRDLGSGEFRFDIDSIYSPSAVRAQALGCQLSFTAP